ncbi:hypothetical protein [Streptomyces bacillaris]|uniref:hypothetical protein n=1 Tax=Streptomyces bacillaris TaxID=68179 RepID=UPI0013A68D9D
MARLTQPTRTRVSARSVRLSVRRSPYPSSRNVVAATAARIGVSTPRTASTPAPGRSWAPGPDREGRPPSGTRSWWARRRAAYARCSAAAAGAVRAAAARARVRSRSALSPDRSSSRRISAEASTSSSTSA